VATPGASAHTPAPVATPMTSAAAGGTAGSTAGGGSSGGVGTWRISGVDVARNGERLGTLLSVDDEKAHVRRTDGTDISVNVAELAPSAPRKRDRILIISNDMAGLSGTLIGIDGTDGIVKLDDMDIRIVNMHSLVVYNRD